MEFVTVFRRAVGVVAAAAMLGAAGMAHARSDVAFSLGIGVPGVVVGAPAYYPPAPAYIAPPPPAYYPPPPPAYYPPPPPVYYQPAPVVVQPRPIYYAPPAPVYYGPPPPPRPHWDGYGRGGYGPHYGGPQYWRR